MKYSLKEIASTLMKSGCAIYFGACILCFLLLPVGVALSVLVHLL